jgi:L-asparaginase
MQGDDMSLPHIAVASLGGTITMTPGTTGAGVTPTLGADDLIAAVPGLQRIASIETATLASLPGASLSFADVLSALDWAEAAVARGAHGVVLIQGTDTLEETAYLLDLHWSRPEPLVVTGAMRSPGVPGADGHANLLASVQTAASSPCGPLGAVVVMNDEVHAASRARKSHAASTAAFVSPVFGPIGVVSEGRVVYSNRRGLDTAPHVRVHRLRERPDRTRSPAGRLARPLQGTRAPVVAARRRCIAATHP